MLNTRYFRFGRKFRLSVCPLGHDFYEENIIGIYHEKNVQTQNFSTGGDATRAKILRDKILRLDGF